jgi:DNA-binding SARP family transcriptional activator/tetratricopeptide (TPR) repeat protein
VQAEHSEKQARTPSGASRLWIGVLGPLRLVRDGTELPPIAPSSRRLLALLILADGAPVSKDAAMEVLWERELPPSAAGILHTYISRLRSLLGTETLLRDSSGYRLRLTAGQLDIQSFRHLVSQARRAAAPEDACRLYQEAVALWRGDPLEDVPTLHGHPKLTALRDEHAAAVREFAELADALGWHEKVLPHLKALTTSSPLDEKSHAALMTALAGSGQQARALRVYEDLRQRLDEELGVLPGPDLRAAHARVLKQEIPAPAENSRRLPFQLPAALADFTGRRAELDRLIGALTKADSYPGVPVVAISGSPGIGKTALALYAAHQARDRFQDGQFWVQLAGSSARPRDPGDALGEMLRALGVPGPAIPDSGTERAVALRSALADRKVMVVADDAASAAQVRPLLPGASGCALIVTSRMQLDGLDGATLLPLDAMTSAEATDLLSRIVGPERVSAEPDAASELAEACGAMPLALRIAGAKLAARPSWPVSAMASKLTRSRSRSRLGELDAGELSVRASISSAYAALPERSSRAFRLLALLGPADFAEWVIGVVLGEPGTVGVADDLVRRSLLIPAGVDATGEPRYRLHDLLRDYATERLAADPAPDTAVARDRLLEAWLQLARQANANLPPEPYFPPLRQAAPPTILPEELAFSLTANPIAWFTAERTNLLTTVDQACQIGRIDLARRLGDNQYAYQYVQDRFDDAERAWRNIAKAARRTGANGDAAYADLRVAAATMRRGYSAEAAVLLDECVEQFQVMQEPDLLAFALYWRAACAWDLDDFEAAQRHAERGRVLAREVSNRYAELANLRILGLSLSLVGEHATAVNLCEQAMSLAEALGSGPYVLVALHSLALVCCHVGQVDRSLDVSMRLLDLSRQLDDVRATSTALGVVADACLRMGRYPEAIGALRQALPDFRAHHAGRHIGLCLLKLGYAHEGVGQHAEAVGFLKESLGLFRSLDLPRKVEQAQRALDRCQQALRDGPVPAR